MQFRQLTGGLRRCWSGKSQKYLHTYNRDHDDQICAKYLKCCKQSQNYMYNVLNNTYTPRVPLSSGKFVSCKWKEERDTAGRGCVVRLSLLHLPWRRPDDFDILLPHKRQQRAGRDTTRRGGNEGERRGTRREPSWVGAMTHLASGSGVHLTGLVGCSHGESANRACSCLRVFSCFPSCVLFFLAFLAFPPGRRENKQQQKLFAVSFLFVSNTSY